MPRLRTALMVSTLAFGATGCMASLRLGVGPTVDTNGASGVEVGLDLTLGFGEEASGVALGGVIGGGYADRAGGRGAVTGGLLVVGVYSDAPHYVLSGRLLLPAARWEEDAGGIGVGAGVSFGPTLWNVEQVTALDLGFGASAIYIVGDRGHFWFPVSLGFTGTGTGHWP